MATHKPSGKSYMHHEKHGAWVINRPIDIVHLTGGSWFEPKHFDTEAELVEHLDNEAKERFQYVYENKGAAGVYELANERGIEDWAKCEPCNAETPRIKGECLCCGQVVEISKT